MMKRYNVGLIVALAMMVGFSSSAAIAAEKLKVVVSIPPQSFFVQQIGGELVEVSSMLPEGGLPHTYEPTPRQMRSLSEADMYVKTGVEFETAWWEKIRAANPDMHIVDVTEGITLLEGHAEHGEHKGHEDHGEHEEDDAHKHEEHAYDPHIWLSPALVKIQAKTIYNGLVELDPQHQEQYTAGKTAFLTRLDELDREIRMQLEKLNTRKFLIFHPSWAYFAADYDLEQIPIEVEGKEPSAAEMVTLLKMAETEQLDVIFVQPQTSHRSAETIAAQIDADVEILDPLAADWLENMRKVTRTLANNLGKTK